MWLMESSQGLDTVLAVIFTRCKSQKLSFESGGNGGLRSVFTTVGVRGDKDVKSSSDSPFFCRVRVLGTSHLGARERAARVARWLKGPRAGAVDRHTANCSN